MDVIRFKFCSFARDLLQKTVDIPVLGGWISTVFCKLIPHKDILAR